MKRTEILANVGNALDAMNDLSTVQPRQDSQVLCSASDQYSAELDGGGVTAHIVCSGLELVNKNNSSSSDEDYHQSDDGDHYSELEEVTSDSGEEDLEDPN
eukprot:10535153-Ditylum_brightwellii.AAC.1